MAFHSQDIRSRLPLLALFLIILIGAFLRLGAIQDTNVEAPLSADAGDYVSYAVNMQRHATFSRQRPGEDSEPQPDAVRSPVYPVVLLGILYLAPELPLLLAQYIQAALSTVTILLTYLLCRRFLPPAWACAAAFLTAISPHLVIANVYLLTESLFTFGLLAALLLFVRAHERGGQWLAFLAGAVLGLLALTRAAVQYFVVAVIALLRLEGRPVRALSVVALGFIVVFGAWTARNVVSTGSASDDTLMINFLHHGMYPDFRYQDDPATYRFPYQYDPASPRISNSTPAILSEILRRFQEEPVRHLRWFLLGKPVAFWQWDIVQGMGDVYIYIVDRSPYFSRPVFQWTHALSRLLHAPLVVLGLLGCIACWFLSARLESRSAVFSVRLVAALIIYYQLIHIVGAPFPRYSVPLRPLIYAMAMYCLYTASAVLLARYRGRGGGRSDSPDSRAVDRS